MKLDNNRVNRTTLLYYLSVRQELLRIVEDGPIRKDGKHRQDEERTVAVLDHWTQTDRQRRKNEDYNSFLHI